MINYLKGEKLLSKVVPTMFYIEMNTYYLACVTLV